MLATEKLMEEHRQILKYVDLMERYSTGGFKNPTHSVVLRQQTATILEAMRDCLLANLLNNRPKLFNNTKIFTTKKNIKLHILFVGKGIYTSGCSFSLEGEGRDEGDLST